MCQPDGNNNTTPTSKHVIIAGAGPSGLLMAANLLRRNKSTSNATTYKVTLIDINQDYGKLDSEGLKRHRSWMIGLASHGLDAIREVPHLFEDYVSKVGVKLESFSLHIGTKEFKQTSQGADQEGYIVDRNFVVAAIARFLNEKYGSEEAFESLYDSKIMYVDGENQRVLVRGTNSTTEENGNLKVEERYISYDVLIGCDGIRSAARNAILQHHRDFECDVSDIFNNFKATHIERPKNVDPASLHLFPGGVKNMNGIALPETGDMLNFSMGHAKNNEVDKELLSNDPKVVAKYFKENFKAFELADYDDLANQWVNQGWNTTGQVHCNFYHSLKLMIVIMGDAAHATSPSIGMGMNTALADASVLIRLLDEYDDNWEKVLPAFSEERVKEGNALTDLAYHLYPLSVSQGLRIRIRSLIRGFFAKKFPGWVLEDPNAMIGRKGVKLSEVYNLATKLGWIPSVRKVSNEIRMQHFERSVGMVTYEPKKWLSVKNVGLLGLMALVYGASLKFWMMSKIE